VFDFCNLTFMKPQSAMSGDGRDLVRIEGVSLSDGERGPVGQSRSGFVATTAATIALSILFSLTRTLAKITRSRGAKWGATTGSFQATPGHCQPPSTQLDPTSGYVRTPPGTHRRCLLSSGSLVRILPGALTDLRLYLLGAVCASGLLNR
jgi:hypothetical protein